MRGYLHHGYILLSKPSGTEKLPLSMFENLPRRPKQNRNSDFRVLEGVKSG
jgi:hypothetical protein